MNPYIQFGASLVASIPLMIIAVIGIYIAWSVARRTRVHRGWYRWAYSDCCFTL